ncbi:MAG: DUF433 domain-containing protein [Nitrospirota bacterium]
MLAKHYGFTDEELDFIINYDTCLPAGRSSTAWARMRGKKYESWDARTGVAIQAEPWEHDGSDLGREEATVNYQQFIVRDPKVCGGEPVIKGTRVTVRTVLASLAEGAKVEEILEDFPTLKEEDVRAVIAFAAASAEEDLPVQSVPDIQ